MKKTTAFAGALFAFAAIALLVTAQIKSRERRNDQFMRDLQTWLSAHETELTRYADAVAAGQVAKKKGVLTFPPPDLPESRFNITGSTVDANTNVYLILRGTTPMSNPGIIRRRGDAPLLGDGTEPQIVHTNRLQGNWWYYRTR